MIILVMATTGAGKTTVGKLVAARLGWIFLYADNFQPPANIEKVKQGIPLTDADRAPWLENNHTELVGLSSAGKNAVLGSSPLNQSYRDKLSSGVDLRIAYFRSTYDQIRRHIEARRVHLPRE